MKNFCIDCNKLIDYRSRRCVKCRSIADNPFKGKQHSKESKAIIGKKSSKKFTKQYIETNYTQKFHGNRHKSINGYTLITDYKHPNRDSHNNVLEHRMIMSQILGRPLTKKEIVHHINFVRNDNRPENLYLCSSRKEHNKEKMSLFKLVKELIDKKIIYFKNGEYMLNMEEKDGGRNVFYNI